MASARSELAENEQMLVDSHMSIEEQKRQLERAVEAERRDRLALEKSESRIEMMNGKLGEAHDAFEKS